MDPRRSVADKKSIERNASILFLGENGYFLQPLRRSAWAPKAFTPVQRVSRRHEWITAVAVVTRAPWASRIGLY